MTGFWRAIRQAGESDIHIVHLRFSVLRKAGAAATAHTRRRGRYRNH